jgi:hypothetical protein
MKTLTTKLCMLFLLFAGGCTSAYYQAGNYASNDDLYAIHNKTAIAQREKAKAEAEKAEAEARRAQVEALIAQAQADDAENRYYNNNYSSGNDGLVVDTYESAYARRLRGFQSSTYRMPSSYWNLRYSGTFNYLTAYDPAFYNIIVMGDEAWVEPKYITSMFGTWGLATGYTAGYLSGLYNSWYFDWGYGWPYYSYSWGYYHPYWSWGSYYSPWWNYGYWYGGYYPHWGGGPSHGGHLAIHPRNNYRINGTQGTIPRNRTVYGTPSRNYGSSGVGSRGNADGGNRTGGSVSRNSGGRSNGSSNVYRQGGNSSSSNSGSSFGGGSYGGGSRSNFGGGNSGGGSSSGGGSRGFHGR